MYLRFIKLLCTIFLVFTITTFLIVVPVDAAGIDSGLKGLEKISWSKYVPFTHVLSPFLTRCRKSSIVDRRDQHRFSAHIIVVYALTGRSFRIGPAPQVAVGYEMN
jgi:hypothetical protein